MKQNGIFAAAAVFLLLFTVADLAFPALCGEDAQTPGIIESGRQLTFARASSGSSQQSVPSHDCFCCCMHVLAGHPFVLQTIVAVTQNAEPPAICIASPPIPVALDPPRIG